MALENFWEKMEDIVPEHRKNHARESVPIKWENLPNAYNLYVTSISIKTVELQSFCSFWLISFSCNFSIFELES